ncbi:hypothetical protein GF396_01260 [Candidatus Pacearchaeota archaeon]|nr:hypothetical protein [Candidatus Pacearchaeota archaeon]
MNVGILGCANIAKKYMIWAFKSIAAEFQLERIYVSSREKKKAEKIASQFNIESHGSYDSMVNDSEIDIIYIPLPIGLHEKWVIKSAKKGKHILCEKSLSDNFNSVKRMIKVCKKNKVVLFENFMCDYHIQHEKVMEIIRKGKIGKPWTMKCYFGFPPLSKNNFRYKEFLGGGSLNDAGAYTIFMARKILDSEPISVTANLSNYDSHSNFYNVDIKGNAMVEFKESTAFLSFGFDNVYQNNYSIWGSEGMINVERAFSIPPNMKPNITLYKNNNSKSSFKKIEVAKCNHFEKLLKDFFRVIKDKDDKRRKTNYSSLIKQAKSMESLRNSAKKSKKIFLNNSKNDKE